MKWAGGKTRILGELTSRMPPRFNRLVEPFVGGGAVFFATGVEGAILGDVNEDLVELYAEVARDPIGLHERLRELFDRHAIEPGDTFYGGRTAWNESRARWAPQRRAATFLYLNKTCFNGLFRVNRAGEFNVPVGRPSAKTVTCPSLPQLVAAGSLLRTATISCRDYVETIAHAEDGDFVYLDPPYLALPRVAKSPAPESGRRRESTRSFSDYTQRGFGEDDHRELARHARALVERGVHVMASNADVPLARELYASGFEVAEIVSTRPISASAAGRKAVGELIFTSYSPSRGSA